MFLRIVPPFAALVVPRARKLFTIYLRWTLSCMPKKYNSVAYVFWERLSLICERINFSVLLKFKFARKFGNSIRTSEIQFEFRCKIRNYIGNLRNFATNWGIIWQKLCEIDCKYQKRAVVVHQHSILPAFLHIIYIFIMANGDTFLHAKRCAHCCTLSICTRMKLHR